MSTVSRTEVSGNHRNGHDDDHADIHLQTDAAETQSVEWTISFPEVIVPDCDAETTAPVRTRQLVQSDYADEACEVLYRSRRLGSSRPGDLVHKVECPRRQVGQTLAAIVDASLRFGFAPEIVNVRPVDRPPLPRIADTAAYVDGATSPRPGNANFEPLTNADLSRKYAR